MSKPVILTGLRASNDLHIGNYFGAVLPLVDMATTRANDYEVHLMVADLHTLTTPTDYSSLQKQIIDNLRFYVAAGLPIGHDSVNLFRQSYIPAHSELTWILDCFTGIGEMSRMTQFKDKSQKLSEDRINLGLFNYPVLMACDVLLYNAEHIPVGDDQSQHLEYTRDIAERMNAKFGDLFTIPHSVKKQHEFFGKDQGLRIKDLQDPTKKMSKSDDSGKGVIFLGDSPEEARKKIMSAETDSLAMVAYNPDVQPGIANLLQIYGLLVNKSAEQSAAEFSGGTQYGEFKARVADKVAEFLSDFQTKLATVEESKVVGKLHISENQMNIVANKTLARVQKAVGLR
jgi:tryptophanyl-tRNA synthetase